MLIHRHPRVFYHINKAWRKSLSSEEASVRGSPELITFQLWSCVTFEACVHECVRLLGTPELQSARLLCLWDSPRMQEHWSRLPVPSPGDLPNPGIELASLASPATAGGVFFFYHWCHVMVRLLNLCMSAKSLQSCLTLCDPMDCSLPGSSVHGILQASILEWVAMPSSRGSSQPRDWTCIFYASRIGRGVLYR